MAIAETIKALGTVVVEAVKEHPAVACGVAAVAVVGTGGTIWYRKRKQTKAMGQIIITPEVAAVAAAAVANAAATAEPVTAEAK